MIINLNKRDVELLLMFLEQLDNEFAVAGCNDMQFPDDMTEADIEQLNADIKQELGYDEDDDPVYTDSCVLEYLVKKLESAKE